MFFSKHSASKKCVVPTHNWLISYNNVLVYCTPYLSYVYTIVSISLPLVASLPSKYNLVVTLTSSEFISSVFRDKQI